MTFLLETNVVSEWTKPKPNPNLIQWLASVDEDRTFLSVITIAEIKFGIERLKPGKRRVNLIPVGFTPMPAATALFLIVLIGVVIGGYIA